MTKNFDFLEDIAAENNVAEVQRYNVVERAIFATIKDAKATLRKKGKVSSGALSDIQFTIKKNVITIGHKNKAAKYADFIDQGVNGTQTNYGAPYSYKSKMPSRAMVDNIKKWLKGNKRSGRNEDQKKGTNNVQKKREGLQDTQDNAAFGIAISVLRKGHKPTHFLSDAVKKNFGKKFIKDYAKEFGKIIKANITNDYNK